MLKYKTGNLIDAALSGEVHIIAHQANCFCTMRSGVAKAIAEAFPSAREVDESTKRGARSKLGCYSVALDNNDSTIIFNLYGQYGFKNFYKTPQLKDQRTDYNALRSALKEMRHYLATWGLVDYSVGLPKLGSGLGGGKWSVIETIIAKELNGLDVTIYSLEEKKNEN